MGQGDPGGQHQSGVIGLAAGIFRNSRFANRLGVMALLLSRSGKRGAVRAAIVADAGRNLHINLDMRAAAFAAALALV
jgi:hypothetical protein